MPKSTIPVSCCLLILKLGQSFGGSLDGHEHNGIFREPQI